MNRSVAGSASSTAPRSGAPAAVAPAAGGTPPGGVRTLNRDFKHVTRQPPAGLQVPGWVAFASGLALGLAVAVAVWLHYRDAAPAVPMPAASATPASARASDDEAVPAPTADADSTGDAAVSGTAADMPPAGDPIENLTFYDLLPVQEVAVPKDEAAPATRPARQELLLQAGAFRTMEQAEKQQARLQSLGVESKIQPLVQSDETLYRVRLKPIATAAEYEQVKAKLAEASIEFQKAEDVSVTPLP